MINNRLFKKINSIFWGVLTWLPIFNLILCVLSFDLNPQIDYQYSISVFLNQFFDGAAEVMSNSADLWFNPLSPIFSEFGILLDNVGSGSYFYVLTDVCAWVCFVQVFRLLVYVFMWFIDLITGLFDLMTFKRKDDN